MERKDDQFIGGQFAWFIGRVVDVNDPLNLNRVKVLPYGYYSQDIKTTDLPWSTVMMPNTTASLKGNGANHQLEIGSWVVGFFRDGPSAQDVIIMGSIATQTDGTKDIPSEAHDKIDNKVYKSKAGHLVEIDNTDGSERINIKHKSGTTINIASDGTVNISSSNNTVNIVGNTKVTGTIHATGDISTDAGNAPSLAEHKHIEVPGTGGSASPTPAQQNTSKPDEKIV